MPVQTQVKPRMTVGAAGTHVTAWSAANAPVNTRALEGNVASPFGLASIRGAIPGKTVHVPTATFDAANFEGVIMNNFLIEHDLSDGYVVTDNAVGVCRHGDVWVQVADGVATEYGTPVQVIPTTGQFGISGGIAIDGAMFTGEVVDGLAPVEFRRG